MIHHTIIQDARHNHVIEGTLAQTKHAQHQAT